MTAITFTIDGHLPSRANVRGHWRKWRPVWASQRAAFWAETIRAYDGRGRVLPVVVILTRISPRPLDSQDNLRMAFKSPVDGIADAYGKKDNNPGFTWRYAQEKGNPPRVRVEIEGRKEKG